MAYEQIELDKDSKELTTISTLRVYYTRLIYIWISVFSSHVSENYRLFAFRIRNWKIHVERLKKVLTILRDSGFTLSGNKCHFFKERVCYLGHIIDINGLHMDSDKVISIQHISCPSNVKELQLFLVMVNYYRRFIPKASILMHPLYELLQVKRVFVWSE